MRPSVLTEGRIFVGRLVVSADLIWGMLAMLDMIVRGMPAPCGAG